MPNSEQKVVNKKTERANKKTMKKIIEKYLKWKEGRNEDYVYDEIHDFISELDRGQLVEVFEYILSNKEH